MLTIKEKMTKTLDNIVEYIRNNPNKLIMHTYADILDKENPENIGNMRCSVSRFMTGKDIHTLATHRKLGDCIESDSCWDLVKSKKIKELPRDFWSMIQSFNDNVNHFDELGFITTRGEVKIETIRRFIKEI